jgi:hypothetical protein
METDPGKLDFLELLVMRTKSAVRRSPLHGTVELAIGIISAPASKPGKRCGEL